MRAFIAVKLPEDILAEAIRFKRECEAVQRQDIRYVEDANLHITLKFLGDIDDKQKNFLVDELSCIEQPAGKLVVSGAGAFPNLNCPKVLWIGIHENAARNFTALFNAVDEVCADAGIAPEERAFEPHLTFARVKGSVGKPLRDFIALKSAIRMGEFTPSGFTLFRSDLTPDGPVYTEAAYFKIPGVE